MEVLKHLFEWSNLYLQLPLGILGFLIAIWQIRDAKNAANNAKSAAEAAQQAADRTRDQFKAITASSLLPQLLRLEEAVERAIETESAPLLKHVIATWIWQADLCRAYLNKHVAAEATTMTKIQGSIRAATTLKNNVIKFDEGTDWIQATTRFRNAISEVTGGLGSLSGLQTIRETT